MVLCRQEAVRARGLKGAWTRTLPPQLSSGTAGEGLRLACASNTLSLPTQTPPCSEMAHRRCADQVRVAGAGRAVRTQRPAGHDAGAGAAHRLRRAHVHAAQIDASRPGKTVSFFPVRPPARFRGGRVWFVVSTDAAHCRGHTHWFGPGLPTGHQCSRQDINADVMVTGLAAGCVELHGCGDRRLWGWLGQGMAGRRNPITGTIGWEW